MENQKGFKISQYACAVLLIVSSIVMVAYSDWISISVSSKSTIMKNQTNNPEATLSQTSKLDGVRLSPHFKLNEFIKADKYPSG